MSVLKYKDPETGEWKQAGAVKVIGISDAVVDPLEVAENGTYTPPDGVTGFAPVVVDVQPNIQPLTITESGTYTASGDVDGYSPITVEIASSGGGEGEITTAEQFFASNVTHIDLPNITQIKANMFTSNTTLKTISMPKVTKINGEAFDGCKNLEITSLPSGLTSISLRAFRNCSKMALTKLPEGVSYYNGYMFHGCSSLAITEIPSKAYAIENYVFGNCTGLTSITFKGTPAGTINANAFNGCTNLITINVPWAEGAKPNAPWGATNATINYNYTGG